MLEQPLNTHAHPSASVSGAVLAAQASSLRHSPFSPALQQGAEDAFVDHFERQEEALVVQHGARMFESVRRDARLEPPVRHVLLQTLDRSLSRVSSGYRLGNGPLCKLAALDAWRATVKTRVLDAIARVESGCVPVALSPAEQVLERKQQALLRRVCPSHIARLERLCVGPRLDQARGERSGEGHSHNDSQWLVCFVQHLRRILFFTLDATLGAADMDNLLAFVATPAGDACLATRAALGAWEEAVSKPVSTLDPPEMTELQSVMFEMVGEAAGADPIERSAYYMELAACMSERLHAGF